MSLTARTAMFSKEWLESLAHIPQEFQNCKIEIYDPKQSEAVYVPETNKFTTGVASLYKGPARVTGRRSSVDKQVTTNTTSVSSYQFQIPIADMTFDLRTHHRVRVTESPMNPNLLKYDFQVHRVTDSGNPIEYTFWCRVDQEGVV